METTTRYCELCAAPARVYCDSDQASLCWDCDEAVHGANFLAARHCRTLLCRTCNSLSEWRASGSKLRRMVSVCEHCDFGEENGAEEQGFDVIDVRDDEDFGDIKEENDASEMEEVVGDVEDRENQVVPSVSETTISLKRKRGVVSDLCYQRIVVSAKKRARLRESAHLLTHSDCSVVPQSVTAATNRISSAELGSRDKGRG